MPRYHKVAAENRKAYFDYHVLEKYETGIVLNGNEVKSIRAGKASLKESFARFERGELYIFAMHISPYSFANQDGINPIRQRKLLLKKAELKKLIGKTAEKGLTLIPLKIYFSGNYAKVELGVCKGKKVFDKRDVKKKKDLDRELGRELMDRERK